jgi:hypothetical protein
VATAPLLDLCIENILVQGPGRVLYLGLGLGESARRNLGQGGTCTTHRPSTPPPAQPVRKIPIAPLGGLPVVAVLIGFVIYAIASNRFWALMF